MSFHSDLGAPWIIENNPVTDLVIRLKLLIYEKGGRSWKKFGTL